jgi:1-acyl-sn-glycerol-3-phosphate acyltransferase
MYAALRAFVRAALHLYCGRIRVVSAPVRPPDHAVLLAGNHPNSFLDALVIAAHLPYPMRFLARGDAFRDPRAARILRALFMVPIYRMSEGRAELKRTRESFDQALVQLEQGGSVLVFSEGTSVNGPGLRPLGKGTARIAYRAWHEAGLDVDILPVWLRYDTIHRPFMDVTLATGEVMRPSGPAPQAIFLQGFNRELRERLITAKERVDAAIQRESRSRTVAKTLLLLPALVGLVLHAPWYFALRGFTARCIKDRVFFDSVLFALLFLTYPFWLLVLIGIAAWSGMGMDSLVLLVAAPLLLAALRGFSLR